MSHHHQQHIPFAMKHPAQSENLEFLGKKTPGAHGQEQTLSSFQAPLSHFDTHIGNREKVEHATHECLKENQALPRYHVPERRPSPSGESVVVRLEPEDTPAVATARIFTNKPSASFTKDEKGAALQQRQGDFSQAEKHVSTTPADPLASLSKPSAQGKVVVEPKEHI